MSLSERMSLDVTTQVSDASHATLHLSLAPDTFSDAEKW